MKLDQLLPYFEEELKALREDGVRFARQYPEAAKCLGLSDAYCDDPHIERLLEGVAFLAARNRLSIDQASPNIAYGLLETHCPDWLKAIPSSTIVQLSADSNICCHIPKHTPLIHNNHDGQSVQLHTSSDAFYNPVELRSVRVESTLESTDWPSRSPKASHVIGLAFFTDKSDDDRAENVSVWVSGSSHTAQTIHHVLSDHTGDIWIQCGCSWFPTQRRIKPDMLGHRPDFSLWPRDDRTPAWHALLTDYCSLPEATRFLSIPTWSKQIPASGDTRQWTVWIPVMEGLDERVLEVIRKQLSPELLNLNTVPASNWSRVGAHPIRLSQNQRDYPLRPATPAKDRFELWRVESIHFVRAHGKAETIDARQAGRDASVGWQIRPGNRADLQSTRPWRLSVSAQHPAKQGLGTDSLGATLFCHQGHALEDLWAVQGDDFSSPSSFKAGTKITASIACKPSRFVDVMPVENSLWQLCQLFEMNNNDWLLADADHWKSMLRLFDRHASPLFESHIESITAVTSHQEWTPMRTGPTFTWVPGITVEIRFKQKRSDDAALKTWWQILEKILAAQCPLQQLIRLRCIENESMQTHFEGAWHCGMWQTSADIL